MKVSREQAAENRERVLEVASALFRERGFDGIGVADLMKSAGLTHGGFYGHFTSKEELMVQASARALVDSLNVWEHHVQHSPDALTAITTSYLSPLHRDSPGQGCLLAAQGAEAARQGPALREVMTAGVRSLVELLSGLLPGKTKAIRREKALATYAGMVGALVLSRAVDDAALSEEILQAVQNSIK
jgi:TetR/AcrR family transcriptional repressor of nem operon